MFRYLFARAVIASVVSVPTWALAMSVSSTTPIGELPVWESAAPARFTSAQPTFRVTRTLKVQAARHQPVGFLASRKEMTSEFAVLVGDRYEKMRAITSRPTCSLFGDAHSTRRLSLHKGERLKMREGKTRTDGKGIEITLDSVNSGRSYFVWCQNLDASAMTQSVQNLLDHSITLVN